MLEEVAAREKAGHGVASQVVNPALVVQLRHNGVDPWVACETTAWVWVSAWAAAARARKRLRAVPVSAFSQASIMRLSLFHGICLGTLCDKVRQRRAGDVRKVTVSDQIPTHRQMRLPFICS